MKFVLAVVAIGCACVIATAQGHVIIKRWLDDVALNEVVDLISGSGRIHAKSVDLGIISNGAWGAKDYSTLRNGRKQAFRIVVADDTKKLVRSNAENYFSGLSPDFGTGLLTTHEWLGYNRGLGGGLVGWASPAFGGGYDMSNGRGLGSLYVGANSYGESIGNYDAYKNSYTGLSSYGLPVQTSTKSPLNLKKEIYTKPGNAEGAPAAQYTVKINHDSGFRGKVNQDGDFGKKLKGKFSSIDSGSALKYSTIQDTYKTIPATNDVKEDFTQNAGGGVKAEYGAPPANGKDAGGAVLKDVQRPVEKRVPYPVKVPYAVHVPRPYPVTVQKTVHVPVPHPVPVHIVKPLVVPWPVPQPIVVPQYVPVWAPPNKHRARSHRHITHFRYF